MARVEALGAELGPAAQRGDQARIDAINREMEQLKQEFQQVMSQGDDQALIEATAKASIEGRAASRASVDERPPAHSRFASQASSSRWYTAGPSTSDRPSAFRR
jgi:hypothetical protein